MQDEQRKQLPQAQPEAATPSARAHMLSAERCRQVLGPEATKFSDHELDQVSEAAWELASLVLQLLAREGRAD